MRRFTPGCLLFLQEFSSSGGEEDAEQSKDSATRNDYAADIIRRGLNKEGWKLVITGESFIHQSTLATNLVCHCTTATMFGVFSCCF